MLPITVNLAGRLCVVVGGGPVGRRKARTILRGGGRVRLICLESRPADETAAGLEWVTHAYDPPHLKGAALVFAAAPAEVNCRVAADARAAGLWVNVADDPTGSDFVLPAVLRRGEFTVAVGTGGAAPALAREVRRGLEGDFDEAFGTWVRLLAELRPGILARVADPEKRRALLEKLCRRHWLDRLRVEGEEAVRAAMRAEFPTIP